MRYTNAMTYQRHSTLININNTWLSASEWLNLFLLIIPERGGRLTYIRLSNGGGKNNIIPLRRQERESHEWLYFAASPIMNYL